MILKDIRDYLRRNGEASLRDLALRFDVPPDALRGMLEHWVARGKVKRVSATSSCGDSCSRCDPAAVEIYRWGDGAAGKTDDPPVRNGDCLR